MTLRNKCNRDQLDAHLILDAVKEGADIYANEIVWALTTLGEPVETTPTTPMDH